MSMSAGSGLAAAAQMMRDMENDMRARRGLRREALRGRMRERAQQEGHAIARRPRADFECFHLCADCGYLDHPEESACPACDGEWLDLGSHGTADALRQEEEARRREAPRRFKIIVAALLAPLVATPLLFAGAMEGLHAWVPALPGNSGDLKTFTFGAFFLLLLAAPALYQVLLRPVTWWLLRREGRKPYRWRLPLPVPAAEAVPSDTVSGPLAVDGEPLVSPVSGRPCVAYQLCVRFDTPRDFRPPEWVLQETHAANCRLGEHVFEGRHLLLSAPLEEIEVPDDEALGQLLRARGLFKNDGDFEVFEAIVAPGAQVEARCFVDTDTVMLAPQGAPPHGDTAPR